ncbi:hypothetical protein [Leptospira stimsonii]|uniref:Uncharacterized protein n=1 Tax=Leptospira stimsonii TaxID=2202203 RepID=A0A8B3CVJ1_9LEPT|nr:hypothetical protein [Leptospira stimsonii]RHX88669.1 hypothetical protein DLM78_07035 [Leptospira stimsonii]
MTFLGNRVRRADSGKRCFEKKITERSKGLLLFSPQTYYKKESIRILDGTPDRFSLDREESDFAKAHADLQK